MGCSKTSNRGESRRSRFPRRAGPYNHDVHRRDPRRPRNVDSRRHSNVSNAQVPVLPGRLGEYAKSDPLLPFLVDPGTEGVRQDRLFREQAPNAPDPITSKTYSRLADGPLFR